MSLSLYMDEHVDYAITRALRRRQVDVLTVQDDEMRSRPDSEVLDRAELLGRVVVTEDDDFLKEASSRQQSGKPFVGIIYAPHSLDIGRCVESLELLAKLQESDDCANRVIYLPL